MSGVMLGARERAMLLATANPGGRICRHALRINAERARLHDRILGLYVEIADRCEYPVEPDRTRLGSTDLPAGVRRIEIVEIAERGGRRELGETLHLLPRPALEVRADQEWTARKLAQRARERGHGGARAAKENESAHSCSERLLNLGSFGPERSSPPAQRRTDEARTGENHAGGVCLAVRLRSTIMAMSPPPRSGRRSASRQSPVRVTPSSSSTRSPSASVAMSDQEKVLRSRRSNCHAVNRKNTPK